MQKGRKPLPANGRKIKVKLVEFNMTQRQLAEEIGMNENYLTDVLNGRRSGKKYMAQIYSALGLSSDDYEAVGGVR